MIKRLEKVRLVDPATMDFAQVRFGATVVLEDEDGAQQTWRFYGEDEVDVERSILSFRSPLGQALMGKEEGDSVVFMAPKGRRELEIVEVRYEPCPELELPRRLLDHLRQGRRERSWLHLAAPGGLGPEPPGHRCLQ